jgi:hypothetical protein
MAQGVLFISIEEEEEIYICSSRLGLIKIVDPYAGAWPPSAD